LVLAFSHCYKYDGAASIAAVKLHGTEGERITPRAIPSCPFRQLFPLPSLEPVMKLFTRLYVSIALMSCAGMLQAQGTAVAPPQNVAQLSASGAVEVVQDMLYCAVQPPSTAQATPRTLSAGGEQKNTASSPSCSGVVNCSDGCFSPSRRLASSRVMPARRRGRRPAFAPAASAPSPGRWRCR
jgi:hypothetical protein